MENSYCDTEPIQTAFSFRDTNPTDTVKELHLIKLIKSNNSFFEHITKFLSYSDLITLKKCSKILNKLLNKTFFKNLVRSGAIALDFPNFIFTSLNIPLKKTDLRAAFNAQPLSELPNYIKDDINKDIGRTFYNDFFNSEDGRNQLTYTLEHIAQINPQIGYCQGMNFLAASLLETLKNKKAAVLVFSQLTKLLRLEKLYSDKMADYFLRIFQLDVLMKEMLPDLHKHFKVNEIRYEIFLSKWIISLFSSFLCKKHMEAALPIIVTVTD